ncbi:MAG: glycosyltransferase [Patescibacteria group bacterium]
MRLLFITQKINENDDDLAFVILWIKEFINQGASVKVICLEKGDFDGSFPVFSLGKEKGFKKIKRIFIFLKLIFSLDYDRVFVHMNPEYVTLGGWYWFLSRKPIYLWYTHYTTHIHLWISGILCKRMFAATPQSLPQYEGNPKKTIVGHGIDIDFWKDGIPKENNASPFDLVSVHRICRSKRLELGILTLKYLPEEYTLTVYGRDVEKDYYAELEALVKKEGLRERVIFKGPVSMGNLKNIYPSYRVMINMARETIDKTMLEGMIFGIYPVTTPRNSKAIGLSICPNSENPEDIAKFILSGELSRYKANQLRDIVEEGHSLKSLVGKIGKLIAEDN